MQITILCQLSMTDPVISAKKLKQARLSFGKIATSKIDSGDKENIPVKKFPIDIGNDDEDSTKIADVTFKSIPRKQRKHIPCSNLIEVKADVHQTIQCPEISTSSLESELNKADVTDMVVLSSDSEEGDSLEVSTENPKLSEEVEKNIDDVIESVIKKGLVDGDNMVLNRDLVRDRKKRNRTPSPNNLTMPHANNKATSKSPIETTDATTCSAIIVTLSDERRPKKPRRSILDMWSGEKKSPAGGNPTELKPSKFASQQQDVIEIHDDSIQMEFDVSKPPLIVDSEKKRPHPVSPVPFSQFSEEDHTKIGDSSDDEKPLVEIINDNNAKKLRISTAVAKIQTPGSPTPSAVETTLQPTSEPSVSCTKSPTNTGSNSDINKPSPNSSSTTPPSVTKSRKSGKLNAQAQQAKEEKERLREEKKRLKEEEKLARELERLENKRKKELREEEKKKKRAEIEKIRDEKLKKKQEEQEKRKLELEAKRLEKERKDKEKEKREEEKRARELEKQKFQEEKEKMEEEKKRISKKQVSTFKRFFTSTTRSPVVQKSTEKVVGSFIPFQVKEDMYLSPRHKQLNSSRTSALDCHIQDQAYPHSYLSEVKKSGAKRYRSRTLPSRNEKMLSLSDDGLEVIQLNSETRSLNIRAKLLQFSENNRPPYYGTWRKRSKVLSARNPLKQDKSLFDYDVDSDDEWEDPGEGEDIANSDGEEEGEKDDEDEEGDGFFVPHGYLSDDEGINEGEDDVKEELSDQKLKMKQQEFENSFKQKIKVMTPLTIGCIWTDSEHRLSDEHSKILRKYEIQFFVSAPIDLDEKKIAKPSDESSKTKGDKSNSSSKKSVPEEAIPDLIRMLHGNPHGIGKLVPEFQCYWQRKNTSATSDAMGGKAPTYNLQVESPCGESPIGPHGSILNQSPQPRSPYGVVGLSIVSQAEKGPFWIAKTQIREKIREIGVYGRKEKLTRACWFVFDQVFEKYSLKESDYLLPCKWEHLTFEPDLKLYPSEIIQPPSNVPSPSQSETPVKCSIDKFATKVSAKDLLEKSSNRSLIHPGSKAGPFYIESTSADVDSIIKLEKGKQALQTQDTVDKFTTSKITPEQLIESSRQKLEQEQKTKRRISLTTISLVGDEELPDNDAETSECAAFGVPTHAAFKTFFKIPSPTDKPASDASQTHSSAAFTHEKQTMSENIKPSGKSTTGAPCGKQSKEVGDEEKMDVEESTDLQEAMDTTSLQSGKPSQDSSPAM